MTAYATPGAGNSFVPNMAASGGLIEAFHRNESDFAVNRIVKVVEVPQTKFYWMRMTAEEAGRAAGVNGQFAWPDGAPRPIGMGNNEAHKWVLGETNREFFSDTVGNLTTSNADWDVLTQDAEVQAQKAMTRRTALVASLLADSGNYNQNSAVTDIDGVTGTWAQSTVSRQDIKRSLNHAVMQIKLATLGRVKRQDLRLVFSPVVAEEISVSPEIVNMLQSSVHSKGVIEGSMWDGDWLLPKKIYGIEVEVEDAVRVSTAKGAATQSRDWVLDGNIACLISRVGALEGRYKAPEFSSVTLFVHKDGNFKVETLDDTINERKIVGVTDNCTAIFTSPLSSFLFTGVLS